MILPCCQALYISSITNGNVNWGSLISYRYTLSVYNVVCNVGYALLQRQCTNCYFDKDFTFKSSLVVLSDCKQPQTSLQWSDSTDDLIVLDKLKGFAFNVILKQKQNWSQTEESLQNFGRFLESYNRHPKRWKESISRETWTWSHDL